ncbi:unnamed protein product [Mytilus edulis]|uniref:Tyr recombinase domain-containing protein n=1 Tax=Mytilus edulis TaxID=6550 RepID=A0A8S3RWR1_MYTED|nr:unnamed protein product [Mytilus edulis]
MVKPTRDLILSAWSNELQNDFDKEFLLHGIEFGFDIIDASDIPLNIQAKNHPSASPSGPLYSKAHAQVLIEIENGNYIFADEKPKIISPMGVIPKPGGGIRLIHDCSRPEGSAVNDFAGDPSKQIFQTLDDATKLVTASCYMAKVDLKSAYRSVQISKTSQQVTGFRWTFPDGREFTLFDRKLPFGSKLAPGIFHRLSQAVRRIMSRFAINWSKVVDPCQQITFLGVEIDSSTMEVRLPSDKLAVLKAELLAFTKRSHASKKQLQSLAGKLNWASAVIRGGRVFLRRIINCIMRIKRDWHKARLKGDIAQDILWWNNFISSFNGKSLILDQYPVTSVATDACRSGAGGFFDNDWFYVNWQCDFPFAENLHINELEALSVVFAARRWAKAWQNKRVLIFCDNVTTVSCLNKCSSRNATLMSYLRELFWLSASNNFHIKAVHIAVVPLSRENLARYIAHLSRRLKYNSLCNYLSIIRILHLEAGYSSPIDTHLVSNVLKGARRVLGDVNTAKLPITPKILFKIFAIISFNDTKDVAFWAACLVAFFSFFRKSNLLTPSVNDFDPDRHLSRHNVFFREDGVLLRISKSKTIQFAERCLDIPLPAIKKLPLCPSQALLLNFKMVPAVQTPSPAFLYQNGEDTIPLTYAVFLARLKTVLSIIGFDASLYSGHSFRRGGATFAFQCGVPGELIQSQGDWKSDAYKGYLDPSPSYRLHVMKTFANALKLST